MGRMIHMDGVPKEKVELDITLGTHPCSIEGVTVKSLRQIPDARGRLMEVLRCDWTQFVGFGQAYVTTAYRGAVKAWHMHRKQTDNIAVVSGTARVAVARFDPKKPERAQVEEWFAGVLNPLLIHVPPGIWHGFMGLTDDVVVMNVPDKLYDYKDPDEERLDPDGIPAFNWRAGRAG